MYIRITFPTLRLSNHHVQEIYAFAVLVLMIAVPIGLAVLMASGEANALADVIEFSCGGTHGGFVTQSSFERVICP